jgi:predicted GTPase
MFGSRQTKRSLRLVVGLNQVDNLIPNSWNNRLNMPDDQASKEIERKCRDITKKLSQYTSISPKNFEYYSALKRYRLMPLLTKIINHAYAGFKLDNIQPADPFELADDDIKAFVNKERLENNEQNSQGIGFKEFQILEELKKILPKDDLDQVVAKLNEEKRRLPKIAIFGKTGVGKTTTVNSLFNANWKTSHNVVGTTEAQVKVFDLLSGGSLEVVDLPGYGRSISEDREYDKIYQDLIPSCDLVFLIIQATARDFADDEEMIVKVSSWLNASPNPTR